jgi:hypothetical protein
MMTMPNVFSRRVKIAAKIRIMMVTGIAARVSENSTSVLPVTITTNWTVNPRKKKKSNFKRAM